METLCRFFSVFCLLCHLVINTTTALGSGLPSFNVDEKKISVSGLSSGAFMAVQMHVAFSKTFTGAGIIAGGPYFCAKHDEIKEVNSRCLQGKGLNYEDFIKETLVQAGKNTIDKPEYMKTDRVYLFSQNADSKNHDQIVAPAVMDALNQYYMKFVDTVNILYDNKLPGKPDNYYVAHGMPTNNLFFANTDPATHKPIDNCAPDYIFNGVTFPHMGDDPWIYYCNFSLPAYMLNHIFGYDLAPPAEKADGFMFQFDQLDFADGIDSVEELNNHGIGTNGYLYVPKACAKGTECSLHVALHGCEQFPEWHYLNDPSKPRFGDRFYDHIFNKIAEANNIIMLYPQAHNIGTNLVSGVNPKGCWEFWGFRNIKGDINNYYLKSGRQMAMIKKMIDQVKKGFSAFTHQELPTK
ncbi:MAG: hypothetical protein GY749_25120 [Desulfobacteraceae bacterium]|nr:hypothetical protein [Desulfobacteraceae bacterium]